jgi:hypothetical protein
LADESLKSIIEETSDKGVEFYRVGDLVNKVNNDSADNILPFDEVKYDRFKNYKLTYFMKKGTEEKEKKAINADKDDVSITLDKAIPLKNEKKAIDSDQTTRASSMFEKKTPDKRRKSNSPINNTTLKNFVKSGNLNKQIK